MRNNIVTMKEEMDIRAEVGRLIREEIKKKKVRGKLISKFAGHSEGWLSQIIHGRRRLQISDLLKIAKFLRVQPGDLLPKNLSADSKETIDEVIEKRVLEILERKKTEK